MKEKRILEAGRDSVDVYIQQFQIVRLDKGGHPTLGLTGEHAVSMLSRITPC